MAGYERATRDIREGLGSLRLERLTPAIVGSFVGQLAESGLSTRSRRLIRVVLSQACKAAVGWRLIPASPCDYARPIRLERAEPQALSVEKPDNPAMPPRKTGSASFASSPWLLDVVKHRYSQRFRRTKIRPHVTQSSVSTVRTSRSVAGS